MRDTYLVNFIIALSRIMRTSSIANFLLFRLSFWEKRKEESREKEERKERWHSWNFPASFFLSQSVFFSPSLPTESGTRSVEYRLYGPCFVTTRRLYVVLPG